MKRTLSPIMKKTLSLILVLCMLLSLTPAVSAAATEAPLPLTASTSEASPAQTVSTSEASIPSAYDARNDGLVTPIKSQGPFGTCWAHAVCAVAETNMIKKGLADNTVDYSELHLAYFASQRTDDPLGNYTDEGMYLVGSAVNYTFLSSGGDPGLAGYTLMRGTGLVDEATVPYSSADDILKNGLDPSLAYSNVKARLTDIYYISFSQPEKIKQAILDNGAVATTLNDASYRNEDVCYNAETGAYYKSDGSLGSAHSVAIIGWDDTFAVENFNSNNRPQNPGAWLIKDSSGEDWGIDGYWWASYEDVDFNLTTTKKVAVMKFDDPSVFERTYQYDGSCRNSSYGFSASNVYMANMFTSSADEFITSVSFSMSYYPNREYKLYIYKNLYYGSPSDGDLVYSSTGITPGGYITVKLDKEVPLKAGDTFSVVIGYSGADEDGMMWMDYDVAKNDGYFAYSAHCSHGQSFYTTDPVNLAWTDYADTAYYGQANFRIKAHTRTASEQNYSLNVINGTDLTNSAPYTAGSTVAIKADNPSEGQRFKNWTASAGVVIADSTNPQTTITMPGADATVTAVYEDIPPVTYSLTVIGGTDLTSSAPYVAGSTVAIKASNAPEGQRFKNWTASAGVVIADSTNPQTTITMPAADATVTAVFEDIPPVTYSLTVIGGTDLTSSAPYVAGSIVAIKAGNAPEGQRFKNWTASKGVIIADSTNPQTTITMPAADATVTAVFEDIPPVTYKLTVIGGIDLTDSAPYVAGFTVSIKAVNAPEGQRFKNWTASAGVIIADSTNPQTTITMPAADATVTAIFEDIPPVTYKLTVIGGADLTGSAPYVAGSTVTIKANNAPEGQKFKNWTASQGVIIADIANPETTITMPAADATVTAVYEDIPMVNPCVHFENVSISNGRRLLVIGSYALGVKNGSLIAQKVTGAEILQALGDEFFWTFEGSGSSWKIKSAENTYLYYSGTSVILSSSAGAWQYSGGRFFYQKSTGSWFWKKTTNYYLACSGTPSISTGTSGTAAEFYVSESHEQHNYIEVRVEPTCQNEGSVTYKCSYCGEVQQTIILEKVDHKYGDDHLCVWCGQRDPNAPEEEVTVNASVTVSRSSWSSKKYTVTINASAQGGSIEKVEYSTNNGSTYNTGTSFTAKSAPKTVMLRITDSSGKITYFKYDGNTGVTTRL